ncbi:MAG TPA: hypothetical protein VMW72_25400 [Sedimentisphaerales bacterium]|nr:hypothetical protein [Sedimentisphaerales bacterium]
MKDKDVDKYLKQHLSGDPPREAFKQQTLRNSTAALVRVRRRRSAWRRAEFAAAAVLIAGVAFIGGRLSAPRTLPRNVDVAPRAVAETDGVTVPSDLVAWLDAARLFKRLGMEERMARAVEHAGKLLPYDAVTTINMTGQALAAKGGEEVFENQNKHSIPSDILGPHESVESISGIIAQSFGGNYYESKMD